MPPLQLRTTCNKLLFIKGKFDLICRHSTNIYSSLSREKNDEKNRDRHFRNAIMQKCAKQNNLYITQEGLCKRAFSFSLRSHAGNRNKVVFDY